MEEPGGLQSMGSHRKESDMTERLHFLYPRHWWKCLTLISFSQSPVTWEFSRSITRDNNGGSSCLSHWPPLSPPDPHSPPPHAPSSLPAGQGIQERNLHAEMETSLWKGYAETWFGNFLSSACEGLFLELVETMIAKSIKTKERSGMAWSWKEQYKRMNGMEWPWGLEPRGS